MVPTRLANFERYHKLDHSRSNSIYCQFIISKSLVNLCIYHWQVVKGACFSPEKSYPQSVKGTRSITEFMLEIKGVVDELSLIGTIIDPKDIVFKFLNGLDDSC